MDSGKIKALATGARVQLMDGVRASLERVLAPDSPESINESSRVNELRNEAKDKEALIERVAYTWFNRLCALRLMDSRGYTPVPVVTPRAGETMPAILADARRGVFCADYPLKPADRQRVMDLVSGNTESVNPLGEAYVILLLSACDYFAKPIPSLFGSDLRSLNAMRLLAPTSLLADGSVLQRIVRGMDDENCKEVEVMGWLYQFYIAERKDEVFAGFKKNKKAGSKELAPATQLFTPHWIVRYMVENSLGRLWMLNFPDSELINRMDYYIDSKNAERDYLLIDSPEDITFLDPAMGSGHILVYAFDLLFDMYIEEGYRAAEIPALIFRKNLTGFEIDDRAAEIASFALAIKAREVDEMFFDHPSQPSIVVFQPIVFDNYDLDNAGIIAGNSKLLSTLSHLDEIGSLYHPDPADAVLLANASQNLEEQEGLFAGHALAGVDAAALATKQLSKRFSVVVANPPYMSSRNMNSWLSAWLSDGYGDVRGDLYACFIKRCRTLTCNKGFTALVTMQSWSFESSFERFRNDYLKQVRLISYLQLGIKAFEGVGNDVVQTCAFVSRNGDAEGSTTFIKLDDYKDFYQKQTEFHSLRNRYYVETSTLLAIPGAPITAFYADASLLKAWDNSKSVEDYGRYTGSQNITADNETYLRLHWEVSRKHIHEGYWVPYAKGGDFRRYYGNLSYVVDWRDNAREHYRATPSGNLLDEWYWYREGITYSAVTSRGTGFRYLPSGCVFDKGGATISIQHHLLDILGLLNSKLAELLFKVLNPSINLQVRDIKALPVKLPTNSVISDSVSTLVELAKADWDSRESSLDFSRPYFLEYGLAVKDAISNYVKHTKAMRQQAAELMEAVDSAFAELYHVSADMLPAYEDRDIPVTVIGEQDATKMLVSYAIGCMFGRYSLDMDGLVLADQGSTVEDYLAKIPSPGFMPDEDGILPITEEEWFEDDIVTEFWRWLKAAFGEEHFDENLAYIEEILGCKLREYFIKGKKSAFYDDHCKTYSVTGSGKRPIYWMFSSPKSSFNCLVYLHRYDDRTVSKILTDYVRELRRKLEIQARSLEASDIARDRTRADKYHDMIDELNDWERDILYPMAQRHIKIDLDDGVRHNYKLFPGALRKVTGLS